MGAEMLVGRKKGKGLNMRSMKMTRAVLHELKCWPIYYRAILDGGKTFDVRKGNDRDYRVGDFVLLREWDHKTKDYTGAHMVMEITYFLHGGKFLPDDVWVLALKDSDGGHDS